VFDRQRHGASLVALLGHGDDKRGFMLTMPLFAAAAVIMFLLAFRNLEEVVEVPKNSGRTLGSFGAIAGNWP